MWFWHGSFAKGHVLVCCFGARATLGARAIFLCATLKSESFLARAISPMHRFEVRVVLGSSCVIWGMPPMAGVCSCSSEKGVILPPRGCMLCREAPVASLAVRRYDFWLLYVMLYAAPCGLHLKSCMAYCAERSMSHVACLRVPSPAAARLQLRQPLPCCLCRHGSRHLACPCACTHTYA